MATYKSEIYIPAKNIPIRKDSRSFEERHKTLFEEMQERMEQRRREWRDEVELMRQSLFKLDPIDSMRNEMRLKDMDLKSMFFDGCGSPSIVRKTTTSPGPGKLFKVSFDVKEFKPEEITVKTKDNRLVVEAQHEEKIGQKTSTKSFSKTVELPKQVNADSLVSSLSTDGILQVEAPVSAPAYQEIVSSKRFSSERSSTSSPLIGRRGGWIAEDETNMKLVIDVNPEYELEDIKITTEGRKLKIKGKHEVKSATGSRSSEFSREIDLPYNSNPNTIKALMNDAGQLLIYVQLYGENQGIAN